MSNAAGRQKRKRSLKQHYLNRSNGRLADLDDLKALVNGLKEMDAMEMVIGGGEPTEHPGFYRFLKDSDFGDLCVSFTTRDLGFVHSLARANGVEESEVVDVMRNKVKAIGLSVRSAEEVGAAERNLAVFLKPDTAYSISNPQVVFHVVPNAVRLNGYDGNSLNQAFDQIGVFKPEGLEQFK